ncbi:MAG: DoxX family protein [Anaerolineae bacterium]|nr:DoxX family protein [Anaerolineae bacterium]
MNILLWVVQVLLLGMYGMAGILKGFTPAKAKEQLAWAKSRPEGLIRFIGIVELLGALGMVLPMLTGILPWLTPLAAAGLVVVQVLAIFTVHVPDKDYKSIPFNVVLLLLALFVAWGRWGLFAG